MHARVRVQFQEKSFDCLVSGEHAALRDGFLQWGQGRNLSQIELTISAHEIVCCKPASPDLKLLEANSFAVASPDFAIVVKGFPRAVTVCG